MALVCLCTCACKREPSPTPPAELSGASAIDRVLERLAATLKLFRQSYSGAVANGRVKDPAAYRRAAELLDRVRREWAPVADAAGKTHRASQRRLAYALDTLDGHVSAKEPTERAGELVEAALVAVAGLSSDRPPPEIARVLEQVAAADAAILAERVVADVRLGLGAGPLRAQFLPGPAARVAAPPSRHAGRYVLLVLRDRQTKRTLPRARVEVVLEGAPFGVPLVETWGEFHHYGSNLYLPEGKLFTLEVKVGPPEVARRAAARDWHARPVQARFTCVLRGERLSVEGRLPAPADGQMGEDVLAARRATKGVLNSGDYGIGLVAGPPEPILRPKGGRYVEEAAAAGSIQLGVALFDLATGSLLPAARVTLTLTATAGGKPVEVPLTFLLGGAGDAFDRYAANVQLAAGSYAVRARVVRPALATLAADSLARSIDVDLPGTWTRK